MKKNKLTQTERQELKDLREENRALNATYRLFELILESLEFKEITQKIADVIPQYLNYETGVLALINKEKGILERTAISETRGGVAALKTTEVPFRNVNIPLDYEKNLCIKAIKNRKQYVTDNLYDLICPAISKENAETIQNKMGTSISIVTPIIKQKKALGVLIISTSKKLDRVTKFEKEIIRKFTEEVGVAIQNSILYTNLEKAKEDLRIAYEKLELLDKRKDEFISVASHELRTPMTIIKSYLWLLKEEKDGKLNRKQKEYIDLIIKSTERLLHLVNDMLNISRMEEGRLDFQTEKLNLTSFIDSVGKEFKVKAEENNIYLKIEKPKKLPPVKANEQRLNEILINLLGNAIKFTEKGGITLKVEPNEEKIKVSVIDTGKGIEKKDKNRLFKKFSRLDNTYTTVAEKKGTGLGLYITKKYVEKMGGEIGFYSKGKSKGSTFWFTLPIWKEKETKNKEEIKSLVLKEKHGNKEKIYSLAQPS